MPWRILLFTLALLPGCQSGYTIKETELFHARNHKEPFVLEDKRGARYSLSELFSNHRGLVITFWQIGCPCVKRYEKRINELNQRFSKEGIGFVNISSNNESFAKVIAEYEKRKIPIMLLRDQKGALARALRAKGTPTAVLFNQTGNVVFMGWIDNERLPGEADRAPYLENAIKNLLANKPVAIKTTTMFGCPIN